MSERSPLKLVPSGEATARGLDNSAVEHDALFGSPIAPGGGGPHDPGMEVLTARVDQIEKGVDRLEGRMDRLDDRMGKIEVKLGEISGKLDILADKMSGQIDRVISRVPTWWQIPAAIGATVVLLAALYAGFKALQAHGLI